jgi:hypothetical protein
MARSLRKASGGFPHSFGAGTDRFGGDASPMAPSLFGLDTPMIGPPAGRPAAAAVRGSGVMEPKTP